jgi:4-hydroxy-tetrahydrodipicolinate reductase
MVSGSGRMGREVLASAWREPDLTPVAVVDLFCAGTELPLPDGQGAVPAGTDAEELIERTHPDVIVDFTHADWTPRLARDALNARVRMVIGTSGLSGEFMQLLERECKERSLGVVVASNFALGAVLMQHMARIASRYYESAEIIELHHDQKVDAPSGTALATARLMAAERNKEFERAATERENLAGARGGEVSGVTIHSVRLPGLVAHQEVLFGGPGETLTIRHDSMSRESFMPGVLLAVREVMRRNELVTGLDKLIGLA